MEPVLIAGAGPVGLTTALLLARWQIPSVVLEAADQRAQEGSRAICFLRGAHDRARRDLDNGPHLLPRP